MNQFFLEERGKEKVKDLMKEGLVSQAYHRNKVQKTDRFRKLQTFVLMILKFMIRFPFSRKKIFHEL